MAFASFGICSIAWPADALPAALDLSTKQGLTAIEIAPYSLFGGWEIPDLAIARLKSQLAAHGLTCAALQGILYKASGAALFVSPSSRAAMARHLAAVAQLAGKLGAKACVFGAPQQRDPGSLAPEKAREIAVAFLREVGPVFASEGCAIAFEANAPRYACRFVTTTAEAIDLVQEIATPGIGLQIDTGTLLSQREELSVLARAVPVAVHAHVSEPDLVVVGSSGADHRPVAAALIVSGYRGSLSIEMKPVPAWADACTSAIAFVRSVYRA